MYVFVCVTFAIQIRKKNKNKGYMQNYTKISICIIKLFFGTFMFGSFFGSNGFKELFQTQNSFHLGIDIDSGTETKLECPTCSRTSTFASPFHQFSVTWVCGCPFAHLCKRRKLRNHSSGWQSWQEGGHRAGWGRCAR